MKEIETSLVEETEALIAKLNPCQYPLRIRFKFIVGKRTMSSSDSSFSSSWAGAASSAGAASAAAGAAATMNASGLARNSLACRDMRVSKKFECSVAVEPQTISG